MKKAVEASAPGRGPLERAGVLAGACGLAWAAVVLGYGLASWEVVLYRLLTDGVIALVWLAAAGGLGWWAVGWAMKRENRMLRLGTAAAAGLGIMSLLVLGLGLAGWLNGLAAWGLVVLGVAGMAAGLWRAGVFDQNKVQEPPRVTRWAWLWLLAMVPLGIAVVGALVPPGVLWGDEPHGYDVMAYHFQIPREWYEAGRIEPLEHNVFSFFPFNVEMHFLLAMHLRGGPWAGMYLAQLMYVGFFIVLAAAVAGVVQAVGSRAGGVVAGVLVAAAPWWALLAPVGYNEGGLLLFGALAVGWALLAMRENGVAGAGGRLGAWAVAGAMAGFACGSKYTAVPIVLIGLPLVAGAYLALERRLAGGVVGLAVYGVVGLIVFSPWMVRNAVWVGNPVFPQAMGLLGQGHFSDVQAERWERAHAPRADQRGVGPRLAAMWNQILAHPGYGYLLLPAGLAAGVMIGRRPAGAVPLGLGLLLLLFWLAMTHLQSRFFVLAIPLAAISVGAAGAMRREMQWVSLGVVLVVWLAGWVHLHQRLMRLDDRLAVLSVLGVEGFDRAEEMGLTPLPPDRHVALVGDAQAFWYRVPTDRLHYRSVFDADTSAGRGVLEAWLAGVDRERAVVIVDPAELARFERTYHRIPPLAQEVEAPGNRPFILNP